MVNVRLVLGLVRSMAVPLDAFWDRPRRMDSWGERPGQRGVSPDDHSSIHRTKGYLAKKALTRPSQIHSTVDVIGVTCDWH